MRAAIQHALVHFLKSHEHLVEPMASLLVLAVRDYEQHALFECVVRYVVYMHKCALMKWGIFRDIGQADQAVSDHTTSKIFSAFLLLLSERLPKLMLKSISYIIGFLHQEVHLRVWIVVECFMCVLHVCSLTCCGVLCWTSCPTSFCIVYWTTRPRAPIVKQSPFLESSKSAFET